MKKIFIYLLAGLVGLAVLAALVLAVRTAIVNAQIDREWRDVPTAVPALPPTTRLEILPLYEKDRGKESFDFGHGVSYLIRTDASTILMDLGNNPSDASQLPSLMNMQALGISWEEIDGIVLSHPHPDHVGGTIAWQNKTFSIGEFFSDLNRVSVYTPIPMTYPGMTTVHSSEPTLVGTDIATTGVISFPEVFPLNLFDPKGREQGLVIDVANEGLVLITGCGHPTLEKLVSRAEALYAKQVVGVVGGLHYGNATAEEVQPHVDFLETLHPRLVALSPHDSGLEVLDTFQSAFPEAYQYIRVGEAIQFP